MTPPDHLERREKIWLTFIFYSCPGRRPSARVIKCVGFFCIVFSPLENEKIAQ